MDYIPSSKSSDEDHVTDPFLTRVTMQAWYMLWPGACLSITRWHCVEIAQCLKL